MTDDDLRDRMRRADPAASLRPLPDDEARRLVAGAALGSPVVPRFSSRRLPVLVGAAAAIALVAGMLVLTSGGSEQTPGAGVALPTSTQRGPETGVVNGSGLPDDGGGRPSASGQPQTVTSTPPETAPPATTPSEGRKTTVAVLTEGVDDPDVRCRRPEAAVLGERAQMAFEATVLRLEGGVVTLQVHRAWIGEADLVEVRNATGAPVLAGFEPEVGRRYLVAASDLQVMGCGYSGLDEPELRAVYDEAFPKR
ncbi:hypothetical protein [Lentzea californiensis]|uniref:hypothetical protein n=1 Tax=Lentzea californiensis TaxID=438851 RepID=UPI002166B66C|nr:hypothetical protein [Lentzea californiensis]MCR3753594.1 hypothetical protein [Lentzea californiensis]